jgi:hypothetical protein
MVHASLLVLIILLGGAVGECEREVIPAPVRLV